MGLWLNGMVFCGLDFQWEKKNRSEKKERFFFEV
jgi:hypothetical protein